MLEVFLFFLFHFGVGEILHIMYHCLLALLYMQEDGEMFEWIPQTEVASLLRCVLEIVVNLFNNSQYIQVLWEVYFYFFFYICWLLIFLCFTIMFLKCIFFKFVYILNSKCLHDTKALPFDSQIVLH